MKILHINTSPFGGAFNGAYRLHQALLKYGISSKMLVSATPSNKTLKEVYVYDNKIQSPNPFNRTLSRFGFPVTANQKQRFYLKGLKGEYEIISFPFSDYDITESKEYQEADIVHLHWVAGFIDYKRFFKKCKKPVIFTLRDLNPIQGIFHYEEDKKRNKYFHDLEKKALEIKISSLENFKGQMLIVGISNWIAEKSKQSRIFKDFQHYVIHNCIDASSYKLYDKASARRVLNISNTSIVFSFVSDNTNNVRKGLDLVLGAFKDLTDIKEIVLLSVGKGSPVKFPFNINHRNLGPCHQSELNIVYGASDALILPSREEALGNVMLEAMACGTPVIGTPVGGLIDVIKPGFNGLLSKDISINGLKEVITEFVKIRDQFDNEAIRDYIEKSFSETIIAEKYISLYKSILNCD